MFDDKDLLDLPEKEMRRIRGAKIGMIFQDPMTCLNPTMTVGKQIGEALRIHLKLDKDEAQKRAVSLLDQVGIPAAAERINSYPHQFSGGMRQRVMIAIALACNPKLLIADEPTTALDVTVQAQILQLLKELRTEIDASVLLITHDLGVVAEVCDRVAVMYAGNVVEVADAEDLFADPLHPYTQGLLASVPRVDSEVRERPSISGSVPNLIYPPSGCRFHPRCPKAFEKCPQTKPLLIEPKPGHLVACLLFEK